MAEYAQTGLPPNRTADNAARLPAAQTSVVPFRVLYGSPVEEIISTDAAFSEDHRQLLRMMDEMPVAVMTVDLKTFRINYINQTSRHLLNRFEELQKAATGEYFGISLDAFQRHIQHQRKLLSDPSNLPHKARICLGSEVLDIMVSAVRGIDDSYIGPMIIWSVVTAQVAAEERTNQLAHYDTLTGLANRAAFFDTLAVAMAEEGSSNALLFVDLDGFKLVNDNHGHLVGDALLAMVARRLEDGCRASGATVGRIGGDEFVILLRQASEKQAVAFGQSLIDSLLLPYWVERDRRLHVGASIGIAFSPIHASTPQALLNCADIALYAAKALGKSRLRVFTPDMELRVQERCSLEGQLRTAIHLKVGLFVFYQPIVDIETKRVTAREALLRWYHPDRGWISPSEFIPLAEESGQIHQLGEFVLTRACHDAASWTDGARVAVNISAEQLGKGLLVQALSNALEQSGLPARRLEIEVTETALLHDELDCLADLLSARAMGVKVALDDFGTGFSSLAHIRAFPFDKIKIDGSFVRDSVTRTDCAAIVQLIADLGKRLGVTTVAEGVETHAHMQKITQYGCSEAQGYLLGMPMPDHKDIGIITCLHDTRSTTGPIDIWDDGASLPDDRSHDSVRKILWERL